MFLQTKCTSQEIKETNKQTNKQIVVLYIESVYAHIHVYYVDKEDCIDFWYTIIAWLLFTQTKIDSCMIFKV